MSHCHIHTELVPARAEEGEAKLWEKLDVRLQEWLQGTLQAQGHPWGAAAEQAFL